MENYQLKIAGIEIRGALKVNFESHASRGINDEGKEELRDAMTSLKVTMPTDEFDKQFTSDISGYQLLHGMLGDNLADIEFAPIPGGDLIAVSGGLAQTPQSELDFHRGYFTHLTFYIKSKESSLKQTA